MLDNEQELGAAIPSVCVRCEKPMAMAYRSTHWQGYVCGRCIQFTEDL